MNSFQEGFANFVATLTAGMLLATGGMLITVGHQQVKWPHKLKASRKSWMPSLKISPLLKEECAR